jgi:CelD/BcsL family acetyltransferase involved in cellulose biosynthesis
MKIELIRASQLAGDLRAKWSQIQRDHPEFESPYFCVEFTEAAAAVRRDVWVAVLEHAGQAVGFFPFHRGAFGVGKPVGERMSDRQGLIVPNDVEWTVEELLQGCRLRAWDFDHLLASQQPFARFARFTDAPFIDLSHGFESYARDGHGRSRDVFKKLAALARKLAREVGPLRFESHCADRQKLHQLLTWKSSKYRESANTLSRGCWSVALLEQILESDGPALAGRLSALWAGDVLIAGHLGMRSTATFQYWIPAYNPSFARYSPGLLLFIELLKWAPEVGIHKVDLGHGGEDYKLRFMSGSTKLGRGSVTLSSALRGVRKARQYAVTCASFGPLRPAWQYAKRLWRKPLKSSGPPSTY